MAVEGYCVQAGCRPPAAFSDGALRRFEVCNGAVTLAAFVRAVLAIVLGDLTPAGRIVTESEARLGPSFAPQGSSSISRWS
ncbi:DUF6420 family protein [Streptomyces eurythermus]|uniref:DUF6420 family protein n=1 Tax=Streptomyces eurythermus TaxID=42237 RepID=UPI0033D98B77